MNYSNSIAVVVSCSYNALVHINYYREKLKLK